MALLKDDMPSPIRNPMAWLLPDSMVSMIQVSLVWMIEETQFWTSTIHLSHEQKQQFYLLMLIPSHFPYTSTAVGQWLTHKLMLRLPHGPESVLYIIPKYSNYRWIQLCKSKLPGSWQKFQKCLSALSSNFMWSKAKHTTTNQKYKSTNNIKQPK